MLAGNEAEACTGGNSQYTKSVESVREVQQRYAHRGDDGYQIPLHPKTEQQDSCHVSYCYRYDRNPAVWGFHSVLRLGYRRLYYKQAAYAYYNP